LNSTLVDGKYQASIGNLAEWYNPSGSLTANIVYEIDIENGRQILYKTQSLGMSLEGKTGPGIVFRGVWSGSIDYKYDPTIARRDAVLYPDTNGAYYAATSGSGPNTYLNYTTHTYYSGSYPPPAGYSLTPIGAKEPGVDTNYWQYLGTEEFFVAAKIAIFEESFIKNTLNIGLNAIGDEANIILTGKTNRPYMAMGQNSGLIGYGNQGIWMGIYTTGPGTYQTRLSLVNTGGDYLRWTGTNLEMSGLLNAGGMKLGANVNGTSDGLYLNANNYWYDTANFKVGDGTSYVEWNGSTLNVKGSITVTGGDAATQTYAQGVANTAQSNAETTAQTALTLFSGSLGAMAAINSINSGNSTTYIGAGTIVTNQVATNLITSTNYAYTAGNFADAGTFIDLSNGNIRSTGFSVQGGNSYFSGNISATSGTIGGWNIGANSISKTVGIRTTTLDATTGFLTFAGDGQVKFTGDGRVQFDGSGGIQMDATSTGIFMCRAPGLSGPTPGNPAIGGGHRIYICGSTSAVIDLDNNQTGAWGLYSRGPIASTGNIYAFYSDERLKNKISNIPNALDKIQKLNGFYYTNNDLAKSFGYDDEKIQIGVSAQEVKEIFPEIVSLAPFDSKFNPETRGFISNSGEDYLTIDYSKLVPVLIEAIKELKAEIEKLKKNK
jgi:hypothetical protein